MKVNNALEKISKFKGESLVTKLGEIRKNLIGNTYHSIKFDSELFEAALEVKRVSAQIHEIVHATGIINALQYILDIDEKIENISLAAGAVKTNDKQEEIFDLETNKRIAEFKFAKWQENSTNGMRKKQVFADFVNLTLGKTNKKKELYVYSSEKVIKYLKGKGAWKTNLSKHPNIIKKLESYLKDIERTEIKTLREIYEISNVTIFDIEELIKKSK